MPQIYLQNFRDRTLEGRTGHYANTVSRPMSFEQRMNDMPVGGEFVGIRHRSIFGSREPGVPREVVAMA